tara:strand:+ start:2542 stop:3207 length:666 start_codon:yes stop_codon:yes gene_type:complete
MILDKISVNKIIVEKLTPLREGFKNKNNKFSAKGYYNNLKVKIYEVFDRNQGPLREFISKNGELSSYFPKLISYDQKYIIEEWVDGKTLKDSKSRFKKNISQSEEVKLIINLMWSIKYDIQVFDYISYIFKRVGRTNNLDLSNLPIRINHNDLSLDNILVTSSGLKIIDNEFLGCNTGWILNIKNSFLKENFNYQNFVSEETLKELWKIRKEWSLMKYNKF